MPLRFLSVSPQSGVTVKRMQLEEVEFWAKIDVESWTDPRQITIEAWTNIIGINCSTKEFRAVPLKYRGPGDGCCGLIYTQNALVVGSGDFDVTFRAKAAHMDDWVQAFATYESPARIRVEPTICKKPCEPVLFQFLAASPEPSANVVMRQFEEIIFWTKLRLEPGIDATRVLVQAWTNLRTKDNPGGDYHGITLPYRGMSTNYDGSIYGDRAVISGVGQFDVAFRAKERQKTTWTWYLVEWAAFYFAPAAVAVESPDEDRTNWAEALRLAPDCCEMVGPVHIGCEAAAVQSEHCHWTHALCVDDGLSRPEQFGDDVNFHQLSLPQGVQLTIDGSLLSEAVEWIHNAWKVKLHGIEKRLLVYSRHGFSRAGCVAVAFVVAENPGMTYEEAVGRVDSRRPLLPHVSLKETLYELYPRKHVSLCTNPRPGVIEPVPFKFISVYPRPAHMLRTNQLAAMIYWVKLDVNPEQDPAQIAVQAWSSVRTPDNADAEFRYTTLPFRGKAETGDGYVYGQQSIISGVGVFEVSFRARDCAGWTEWTWLPGRRTTKVLVEPARADKSNWARRLKRSANFSVLLGPVHIGSDAAVKMDAEKFTHFLCLDEELLKPEHVKDDSVFYHVPMRAGVERFIKDDLLAEAVDCIRQAWQAYQDGDDRIRLLVYSTFGFGRAGSTAIAFVVAENPSMTFEDAVQRVTTRRPVLQHAGLKDALYRLYPRSSDDNRLESQP